jgi:hypothetical protein
MTNEQAAYLAGAIDGEGHIGISKTRTPSSEWQRSPRFRFNVTIANTNKAWLEELQRWCGGRIEHIFKATERKRDGYVLRFGMTEVKALLARITPYLVMKRRQAELALKYFDLAAKRRLFSVNAKPTDPAIVAEQEALWQEMRSLNLHRLMPSKPTGRQLDRRCSLEECERKHYGKGYCWIHYRKFVIRGGPAHHEKACVVCGAGFVSRRVSAECCSRKCIDKRYYAANAERIKAQVKAAKQKRKAVTS